MSGIGWAVVSGWSFSGLKVLDIRCLVEMDDAGGEEEDGEDYWGYFVWRVVVDATSNISPHAG
jgi:hypothetical protein